MFKTFSEKIPRAKIDTLTSLTLIDGLQFEMITMKISLNERVLLTMRLMYKLYKGYDFGISYLYVNDWAKTAIEEVIYKSKFEK